MQAATLGRLIVAALFFNAKTRQLGAGGIVSLLANEGSPPSNNVPACKFCFARRLQCRTLSNSFLPLLERSEIELRMRDECKHMEQL